MKWLGQITSKLEKWKRRATATDGRAQAFGHSSAFPQEQENTFDILRKRYACDIEFNLLLNAFANGRTMIFVNAAAALGVTIFLYPNSPQFAVGWFACILALSFLRGITWQTFFSITGKEAKNSGAGVLQHTDTRKKFVKHWRRLFGIGLLIAGMCWSVILERAVVAGGESKYFACIVIAGLAGGASGICSPLINEGRLYITSLLLPAAPILAFSAEPDPTLAALAILCWSVLMVGMSNNHRVHRQALTLQAENTDLVDELRDLNQSLERKVAKRTRDLEHAAMRDPLTDLPNRRGFRTVMSHVLNSSDAFSVGLIDLDGFKPVNDAFGHAVGDELLIEVGQRLLRMVGDVNQIARIGGDEFGFILKDVVEPKDIQTFGQQLVKELSKPYKTVGVVAEIGASVGLARAPADGQSTAQLYQRADYALYFAKQFHKGQAILFDPSHEAEISQLARIEQLLRRADLENELYVEFQPIVDIKTDQTYGFEALARWNSAELGIVPPSLFIQAAERSGFILELTRQLVKNALQHASAWPKHLRVSINLSARDIASMDAVDGLLQIVGGSVIDPRRIDFEITETALVCDFDQARSALNRLAAIGCRISLDDFGTGHSSLSHLQLLPLDKLKIDSSFIARMEHDQASTNIVRVLILLCQNMDIDCVVEGVETETQLNLIKEMGGHLVQGYHLAKPLSVENTKSYISEDQRRAAAQSHTPDNTSSGKRKRRA